MKNLALLALIMFLSACNSVGAVNQSAENKKQRIIKLMSERQFKPDLFKDQELCQGFFEDFSKQTNIEPIEPLIVTHDYSGPALQKYLKRCPKMELRSPVKGRSGLYVGTPTLKLYRVDIDNNPANGEEYLYLESAFWQRNTRASNYQPYIQSSTSYRLVDFERCMGPGRIHAGASRTYTVDTDLSKKSPNTSYHDVIKYQGKYYVYDLIFLSGYGRPFSLYVYDDAHRRKFSPVCIFTD